MPLSSEVFPGLDFNSFLTCLLCTTIQMQVEGGKIVRSSQRESLQAAEESQMGLGALVIT
jgi:hypothetical protein